MSSVVDLLLKTCTELNLRVGIGKAGRLAVFGPPANVPPGIAEMLRRYRTEVCQRLSLAEVEEPPPAPLRLFVPECPGECPGIGASGCHGCPVELPRPQNMDTIDPWGTPTRWTCQRRMTDASV